MGAVKHPPVGVVTRVVKENLLLLYIIRQVNNNSQYIVLFIGDIEIAVAVKAETSKIIFQLFVWLNTGLAVGNPSVVISVQKALVTCSFILLAF